MGHKRVEGTEGPVPLPLKSAGVNAVGSKGSSFRCWVGKNVKFQLVLCITLERHRILNSSSSASRSDPFTFVSRVSCCFRSQHFSVSVGLRQAPINMWVLLIVHPNKSLIKAKVKVRAWREELVVGRG